MTSAMLPVRGRSRRDMEHGECRGVPRHGDDWGWEVFGELQGVFFDVLPKI